MLREGDAAESGLDTEVGQLLRQILGGGGPVSELGRCGQLELHALAGLIHPHAVAVARPA
jgi:hypothetical protein